MSAIRSATAGVPADMKLPKKPSAPQRVSLSDYRTNVINHEMGHYLGFDHMRCPGAGGPAPIMQTQTIDLGGCVPNSHPYTAEGTFVSGPWVAS